MARYLQITMFVIFGFILTFCHAESKFCYSQVRTSYHYCSSETYCCSSNRDPCCYDNSLTTGAIVGIVISLLIFVVIFAVVVYHLYRASQRKRTGVTSISTAPVQTIHTTTYNQGAYANQGYPPPGQTYPPPPMYGTNQQGSNPAYPPPPPAY